MDTTIKRRENIRALVETAMMVALAYILSLIILFRMPQGGSVTPISMLPILIIGIRHGLKWGLMGGLVFACLEMITAFWPPPIPTVTAYIAVVLLDYLVAFTVLGLSGLFKGKRYGLMYAAPICIFLRFLCHFFSGIFVWSEAPFAQAFTSGDIWLFSLIYNGSYMGIELIMVTIVSIIICTVAPVIVRPPVVRGA